MNRFYRFLTVFFLVLLSLGFTASAEENNLILTCENAYLDKTKGVRLFLDDFKTKDTQITDFNSVLFDSAAISFPQCEFGNVSPYGDGYVTIGYNNKIAQTLVRIDFAQSAAFPFSGGTFTAGYHVAVAKGSTAQTVTALAERLLYNGTDASDARTFEYDHSTDLSSIIAAADNWVWTECSFTPKLSEANTLNAYEIALTSQGRQYYDNIEIWLYPDNAFLLNENDSLSMVIAAGDTVVLPGTGGWKTASGKVYAGGETVYLSQIAGTTLSATDAPGAFQPHLHEKYGVRIAFADFKTKKEEVADFEESYMDSCQIQIVSCSSGSVSQYGDGYYQIFTDPDKYSEIAFFFNDGNGFSANGGKFTAEYDVAVAKGSTAETCTDIYDRLYYTSSEGTERYAEVNHKESLAEVIRIADAWYHETVSFSPFDQAQAVNSYHIYFASHYGRQYYDNLALYYFPQKSYILNINDSLSLVTDAPDTVTLPTGDGYVSFLCDGKIYPAGSLVPLSEIEMKTLTASTITHTLDASELSLRYDFSDDKPGSADGVITLSFGNESVDKADSFVLYWAYKNESGAYEVLPGYTPLRLTDIHSLASGKVIDKNLSIPFGATALLCRISDPLKTFDVVCDLPESKLPTGKPDHRFAVISDVHIGYGFGDGSLISPNSRQLATRAEINALDPEFVVVNGDFTQWYGRNLDAESGKEWEVMSDYFKGYTSPVYFAQGNHDGPNDVDPYVNKTIGIDEFTWKHFEDFMDNWLAYCRENDLYTVEYTRGVHFYDTEIDGIHLIFCSVPNDSTYSFGEEQLKWLSERLYADEASGKPIFVFDHIPPKHKLGHKDSTWNGGMKDFDAFEAILKEHPTVINISGDTHYTLDTVLANTVGADGEIHYVNDGAVIDEWIADDESDPHSSWHRKSNDSMGLLIELYPDRILLRGRNFVTGQWISEACTEIRLNSPTKLQQPSAFRTTNQDGSSTIWCSSNPDCARTVFIVDGTAQEAEKITLPADFSGAIAIRQQDSDGGYVSTLYRNLTEISERKALLTVSSDKLYVIGAPIDSVLAIACYDASGRLTSLQTFTVYENTSVNVSDVVNLTDGAFAKAFLLSRDAKPLCEAQMIRVP